MQNDLTIKKAERLTRSLRVALFGLAVLTGVILQGGAYAAEAESDFSINANLKGWARRYPARTNEVAVEDESRPGQFIIKLHLDLSDPPVPGQKSQTVYVAKTNIRVESGRRYRISARCRTEIGSGAAVVVCLFLKDGVVLKGDGARVSLLPLSGSNEWTELSGTAMPPPDADAMILQLTLRGKEGTVWYDSISVGLEPSEFSGYRVPRGPFLFATPEQLTAAKLKAENVGWAKEIKEQFLRTAAPWISKTREELASVVPQAGALYVYGLSKQHDPETGERLKWGGWSNPLSLRSDAGTLYPNKSHPDPGDGYEDEKGHRHYFTACANGERIKAIEESVLPALTNSWWLSGDVRYANAALWLLDAIATIYPTADSGPIDYPGLQAGVPGGGRLQRPYYQTARALMRYGYCYDLLSGTAEIDQPSPTQPGKSIRDNILQNLIGNGGAYCYQQATKDTSLNNGTLDYNRGVLISGALLGIPAYLDHVAYGNNGLFAAATNAVDPQGRYFESSSSYSGHTADLMVTTAYLMASVNRGLPNPQSSLFDNTRFASFCIENFSKIQLAGRLPLYGDAGPDRAVVTEERWFDALTYRNAVVFLALSANPAISKKATRLLHDLLGGKDSAEALSSKERKMLNSHPGTAELRLLFEEALGDAYVRHGVEERNGEDATLPHSLLSGVGLALLRSRTGAGLASEERAALLRLGPTCNHGHLDELSLQFYAHGREFSADPGYFNTHFRFGFTRTTIAHNTVVVNQRNQLEAPSPGAFVLSWTPGGGFSSVEADNPGGYQVLGIKHYQRRIAQVDCDGIHYLLDVFRLQGGTRYDYSFHAIHGGKIELPPESGLTPIATNQGSLLSDSLNYSLDLLPDGRLKGFPHLPFYWAVPGEGYGFLGNPVSYQPSSLISLRWDAQDETSHRLMWHHFPPQGGEVTLTRVKGPNQMLALEYALSSVSAKPEQVVRFVSVIRPQVGPSNEKWRLRELPLINAGDSDADVSGIEIRVLGKDGAPMAHHQFASTLNGKGTAEFEGGLRIEGREAFVSLDADGNPRRLAVTEGAVEIGGLRLQSRSPAAPFATILEMRNGPLCIRVAGRAEDWAETLGGVILIEADGFAKPLAFQIVKATAAALPDESTWLTLDADSNLQSSFVVDGISSTLSALLTTSQFPRVAPLRNHFDRISGLVNKAKDGNDYNGGFNGFAIASDDLTRAIARISNITEQRTTIHLDQLPKAVTPGKRLAIVAPVVGDRIRPLSWAEATRGTDGQWIVSGPGSLRH